MTEIVSGAAADVLILCDHASNHVPETIDLGIAPELLDLHIAVDIGAGPLSRALAARLDAPALLGTVSRLVIDLHRETDHASLIPVASDGHRIPGNEAADRDRLIAEYHYPYHRAIRAQIKRQRPQLILSIHSFTPRLEDGGRDRPWEVGVLYNRDTRAARPAVQYFRDHGFITGDNEPYSGRLLNATLNRHAEGQGIPSIAIEVRNDLIRDAQGVAQWTETLVGLTNCLRNSLARNVRLTT